MYKWISGRQGRPIAGIITFFVLVSILSPLAPPPVQAQSLDLLKSLENGVKPAPTPIVVIDFDNKSRYTTGMLGRHISDALSIELLNTDSFDVVKRSQVDQVMSSMCLTPPLSIEADAMVADRVKADFTVCGTIDGVKVCKTTDGTFAEVTVTWFVVSRITRLPILGMRIVQQSSPKIGYSGNTDPLVQEALETAAYQIAQRILSGKLPIGVVMTSPRSNQVQLMGGSKVGIMSGMEMVTLRRNTVTGYLRVGKVNPDDADAVILSGGTEMISPGDKAVPVYQLNEENRPSKVSRDKMGLQLAGVLALAGLASMIASDAGNKALQHPSTTPCAVSLADAGKEGYHFGANNVSWSSFGGDRVIAYLIYRDNQSAPIYMVDGQTRSYIDDATPLVNGLDNMFAINVMVQTSDGSVLDNTILPTAPGTAPTFTYSETGGTLQGDIGYYPLAPGQMVGYQIQPVYVAMTPNLPGDPIGPATTYALLLGGKSPVSNRISLVTPPALSAPADGSFPNDLLFVSGLVNQATSYAIQFSTDPSFGPGPGTTPILPATLSTNSANVQMNMILNPTSVQDRRYDFFTYYPQASIPDAGERLYWRMGAKVNGQPAPVSNGASQDNGYVWSWQSDTDMQYRSFILPSQPPSPPNKGLMRAVGTIVPVLPGAAKTGHGRGK